MKVAVRQKRLLDILKYSSGFLTVGALAETLRVSKRTIHMDLAALEEQGHLLEKKPGAGIRLKQLGEAPDTEEKNQYSPEYRRMRLIKLLLFEEHIITYQSMADQFMVSTSSIIADLNYIKKNILHDESIMRLLGDEHGTRLAGKEIQWNHALIEFNEHLKNELNLNFRDRKYLEALSEFYPENYVTACFQIITSLRDFNIYYVAEHYLNNIFNVLLALVFRMSKGYHHRIEHNEFYSDQIMSLMNYTMSKELLELIRQRTNVVIESGDIYFFSVYLKANRITFKTAAANYGTEFEAHVSGMIERMSNCINVDLKYDHDLYENLYLHIIPMMHRLKYGISIKNPMLDEIKAEYRVMYELTWLVAEPFVKKAGLKLNEHEAGFLMLYFQNALEKRKKSKRILVVCPNGIATSRLIANKIRRLLPPLDIIELASLDNINNFDYSNIDFIVSTVPLEVGNITVVVVSMILNAADLKKIEQAYKQNLDFVLPENKEQDFTGSGTYLRPSHIFFHEGKTDKKTIIRRVCARLLNDGMVTPEFESSILEREKKGATDNVFGGAIPHAETATVKKSCLAVWVNSEPVKWTKYKVKVIVFFAVSEQDIKKTKLLLEKGFAFIKSKESIDKLSSVSTREDLMTLIYGGNNFDKKGTD